MSRIRSIHPGIWTDEQFVGLSPFARLLFIGIWNECDDKGTFQWSPLQMKMRILPADNVDAIALLAELLSLECIAQYEIGGKKYGAVRNFCRFQRPKKPNDIHPISTEMRAFVALPAEPETDETPPVPNHSPTASEISPQMEDGEEDGGEELETFVSPPSGDEGEDLNEEEGLRPEHVSEFWNDLAPKLGKPSIRCLTPERRALVKSRIAGYALDDFREVFGNVERSPFLRDGRFCTFDWVMKKGNFQKILEGNYNG